MKIQYFLIPLLFLITSCVDETYTIIQPTNGAKYVGFNGSPPPIPSYTTLPSQIVITYNANPYQLDIYLNGQPIGDKFTYGGTQATLQFSLVKEFLKQGSNKLQVNPFNGGPTLTFLLDTEGPNVIINTVSCSDGNCMDINGGNVTVSVKVQDPSNITNVTLASDTYDWDAGTDNTQYTPFKTGAVINGTAYTMSNLGNNSYSVTVPESSLYTFTAADVNGYVAKTQYLSEGQKVNSVFKMRIGNSLLQSVLPVVEPMLDNMHMYGPSIMTDYGKTPPSGAVANDMLDKMSEWWHQDALFYNRTDMGASTGNINDCGYMNNSTPLTSNDFFCSSIQTDVKTGAKYCPTGNVLLTGSRPDVKYGRCTRIVIWRLLVDNMENLTVSLSDSVNGRLILDMDLYDSNDAGNTALETDLGMRHIECKQRYATQSFCTSKLPNWLGGGCTGTTNAVPHPFVAKTHAQKDFCRDDGGASAALGLVSLGDLKVTATSGAPGGSIDARILNGDLLLNISPSTFKLNLQGLTIGSWLDGLISFLSGLLDGLFVDIVADVITTNMKNFILGFDLFTDAGTQMQMQSHAYQVFTNADNNPSTPVEWYMYYSGFLSPVVPHPDVPPTLGSLFVPIDLAMPTDNPSTSVDNFSIGISSNIINQGLASIYRSGMMHFTITTYEENGTNLFFGPNAKNGLTQMTEGKMRVVLIPHSPATFKMQQGPSGTQATLEYYGAEMDIDIYQQGQWNKMFHAVVDIKSGVLLSVVDKQVHMTIEGIPQITVRELLDFHLQMSGSNGSLNWFIGKAFFEESVKLLLEYAIPRVAESYMNISVPDIAGPNGTNVITTTESIEANNGAHLGFSMGLNLE